MNRLGITGGIGAGKSFVAQCFVQMGVPVYDCDNEAKRLMLTDSSVIDALKNLVSPDVYCVDGSLNKQLLANFVFSDAGNREKVNRIVHPAVFRDFERWANSQKTDIVAVESAILFESGLSELVDASVCVVAPMELRIERVMKRDNTDSEKVRARIASQMSDSERTAKSDFVIVNDGVQSIESQMRDVLRKMI